MDDREGIPLRRPIEGASGKIDHVALRRPKVRDIEAIDQYEGQKREIMLIANLAELTPDEVRELDIADFKRIQTKVAGFFDDGQ